MKKDYEIDLNKQLTVLVTMFWVITFFTHLIPYREVSANFVTDETDLFDDIDGAELPRKIEVLSRNHLAGMATSVVGIVSTVFLLHLNKIGTKLYLIPRKPFFKKKNIRVKRG